MNSPLSRRTATGDHYAVPQGNRITRTVNPLMNSSTDLDPLASHNFVACAGDISNNIFAGLERRCQSHRTAEVCIGPVKVFFRPRPSERDGDEISLSGGPAPCHLEAGAGLDDSRNLERDLHGRNHQWLAREYCAVRGANIADLVVSRRDWGDEGGGVATRGGRKVPILLVGFIMGGNAQEVLLRVGPGPGDAGSRRSATTGWIR